MIKKLKIIPNKDSYTKNLYKKKTFNFSENINVIIGPNGSGKSTLLEILKINCGIIYNNHITQKPVLIFDEQISYSDFISNELKSKFNIRTEFDYDKSIAYHFIHDTFSNFLEYNQNIYSENEAVARMFLSQYYSKGKKRLNEFEIFLKLQKEFDFSQYDESRKKFVEYYQNGGKPILLLDEIDKDLDLYWQEKYFNILRGLSKEWQIIVVTHSIFAFNLKNVNYIILNQEYFDDYKKLFQK
jgi:predicted ATPase